jgi:hypothetical protein
MVSRDRGQIMLVGAVAIAFVILGLTAVYASQLTARPATTGSVGDQAAEATELNHEARRNVRVIAVRVNHDEPYYSSSDALNDSITRETANYSQLMSETYAGGTGAVANVSSPGAPRMGTRIVQNDNETMENGAAGDWSPVDTPTDIGWFVFNFNVTAMDEDESFVVRVENGTGPDPPETSYTFTRNATGTSVLTVETQSETPFLGQDRTCNPRGNRSLIDLREGESFTSSCEFALGLEVLEGPYTVTFEQSDNARGKFSIVANVSESNRAALNGLDPCPASPGDPCNTYAAWNVTVETRYESGEFSYNNTQNVTAYEGV